MPTRMDRKTIGQLAATGGVILSLAFVAYELRQNTAVAQMEAYNNFVDGIRENDHFLASDPILTPLVVRVAQGAMPEDFTDEENFRVRLNYTGLLRLWEGLFRSVESGILPASSLNVVGRGGAFDNAYFRSIWPSLRGNFSEGFVEFFEGLEWVSEQ